MGDPPRLRSEAGLEGLLLRSSRTNTPTPDTEEEVWRRLQIATAAGAATAAGIGASAGSKVAAKTIWVTVLKWTAVVAVGVPVAGVATHWAIHRREVLAPNVTAPGALPGPEPRVEPTGAAAPAPTVSLAASAVPEETAAPLRVHAPAPSGTRDVSSALRKESLALGTARAKLAAGDARAALDDVARLAAEFPHGRLLQEREVLAIDCLEALGDRDGARSRARAFLDRFPQSPYAAHVRPLAER